MIVITLNNICRMIPLGILVFLCFIKISFCNSISYIQSLLSLPAFFYFPAIEIAETCAPDSFKKNALQQ